MGASEETIALLKSIDASLKTIVAVATRNREAQGGGLTVASDADLDGKYGDEVLKFSPRDWTGASCNGKRMSECEAAALDLFAEAFESFARKNDEKKAVANNGKPKSSYDRLAAARCRGWAARKRAGWKPPPPTDPASFDDTDEGRFDDAF